MLKRLLLMNKHLLQILRLTKNEKNRMNFSCFDTSLSKTEKDQITYQYWATFYVTQMLFSENDRLHLVTASQTRMFDLELSKKD
jgi:Fe-S cluster biosynthesis and repair protein YggX